MDVTELGTNVILGCSTSPSARCAIGCASFEDVQALGRVMSGALSSIEHDDSN